MYIPCIFALEWSMVYQLHFHWHFSCLVHDFFHQSHGSRKRRFGSSDVWLKETFASSECLFHVTFGSRDAFASGLYQTYTRIVLWLHPFAIGLCMTCSLCFLFKLHVGSSHFVVWLDLVGANPVQVHLHFIQSCSRESGTQRNLCLVPCC